VKDKEIIVQNLTLELTRKCNLNCGHCMRGDMQNLSMSDEVIERVFEDIDGAFSLQFSGGESSLAVDRLQKVVEVIKEKKTKIRSVLIFTNAVNISEQYIKCLEELRAYCLELNERDERNDFNNDKVGLVERLSKENYPLSVVVSLDKYHLASIDQLYKRKEVARNIDKLIKLFPVEIDKLCSYMIYAEGRGKNIKGCYKIKPFDTEYTGIYLRGEDGYRDLCMIGPVLNISYDGKIVDGNRSYMLEDKGAVGDITTEDFYSMLKKLQKEKGFKLSRSIDDMYKKFDVIIHKSITTTKEIRKMEAFNFKHKLHPDYSYLREGKVPNYEELKQSKEKEMER